jgi:hypothetical protein
VLVEHLRHEALVANGDDIAAVGGGRDPCRLLAAVLQREQREIGEARDIVIGGVDPEDAAFITRTVAVVVHRVHVSGQAWRRARRKELTG